MQRILPVLLLVCVVPAAGAQDMVRLEPGLTIRKSVRVMPGEYRMDAGPEGAVRIDGDDITVDFTGVVLIGSDPEVAPDGFSGTGIVVAPGTGVTVRGVTVRGYKIGLHATGTPRLVVRDSDFSYNWRQRLKSTLEREHNDDWMSYHQNEEDEWLRYGAGLYLRDCLGCRVERVTVTGGQNGLLLSHVNDGVFADNVISFNSSLGIGMYRSSRNRVAHNTLDFNVRGYSHGVYNRGQDSAAILVYEQSNDNEFAYNSATHSGDGFFLWAGQSTMDSGEGGCNGNLLFRNDFSFAPTNGIELTFSSNRVVENYIEGCWHGIWGGYSWDTVMEGNTFVDNDEHIAIEHGQDVRIERNAFVGGEVGLRLWERESQPADWGYAESRDVRSRDYDIALNEFRGTAHPIDAQRTRGLRIQKNVFSATGPWELVDTPGLLLSDNAYLDGAVEVSGPSATGARSHYAAGMRRSHPRNRAYILVDEWGPHDFRSPVFWPRSPRQAREQWFEVVGPAGPWTMTSTSGIDSVSALSGMVGDSIRVWRSVSGVVDMRMSATYTGHEVTDRFGQVTAEGQPFPFAYRYFFVPVRWTVDFWAYDEATDPREAFGSFRGLLDSPPAHTLRTDDLGLQWYGSPADGLPRDHFATRSVGELTAPAGEYVLDLTSDDGVRVWLDDRLIHDDWTYHAPRQEEIALTLDGDHRIVIEHFEIDGYATIVASLRRR